MVLSQIVSQLANANQVILDNIFVQDPIMEPDMRALFENHGCKIVENPAAFDLIGTSTLFLSLYVGFDNLMLGRKEKSAINYLAIFIGNGMDITRGATYPVISTSPIPSFFTSPCNTTVLPRVVDVLCTIQDC